VERDTNPEKWYPHGGRDKYDDLPLALRANVDMTTLPLAGRRGGKPVWNDGEIDAVIAFLKTLNDADAGGTAR
jgi:cytochrome c peroxidase